MQSLSHHKASGIPDYRSTKQVRKHKPIQHDQFVGSSKVRQRYWARSFVGYPRLSQSQPNPAHHALSWLQGNGMVHSHITQNVDGLLQEAGCNSVLEIHGTIHQVHCLSCGHETSRSRHQHELAACNEPSLVERMHAQGKSVAERPDGDYDLPSDLIEQFQVALCAGCCREMLSPSVVFFGGRIHPDVTQHAGNLVDEASSVLIVGSTCATWSAYRLVRKAKEQAKRVAVLTVGETRADNDADLKVQADIPHTLASVQSLLQAYRVVKV